MGKHSCSLFMQITKLRKKQIKVIIHNLKEILKRILAINLISKTFWLVKFVTFSKNITFRNNLQRNINLHENTMYFLWFKFGMLHHIC